MFKVGDKVKIIGNTSGHSHLIGSIGTITCISGNNHYINNGSYAFPSDINLVNRTAETIKAELHEASLKVEALRAEVNYMQASNATIYVKSEHEAFEKASNIVKALLKTKDKKALFTAVLAILNEKKTNG